MSKKLARIITNVPVEFHEENYCLKEWNREALIEVFTELEFKSLGKRILGETFNAFQTAPSEACDGGRSEIWQPIDVENSISMSDGGAI